MVLLTITPAARAAFEQCSKFRDDADLDLAAKLDTWMRAGVGSPVDHADLIELSRFLVATTKKEDGSSLAHEWRLETLLKGAKVYQEPPPPKPEPTPEYKALMKRLRAEEEQRQYERMLNPAPSDQAFNPGSSTATYAFHPATSIGQAAGATESDEITFADVNRQLALIINVLVSIICCAVAIWVAARRWAVPLRLGMSMSGSGLVAVAEVVIYMGYIRRLKDAKSTEQKKVETKEIVETWVLDGGATNGSGKPSAGDGARYRKGRHR